MCRLPSPSAVGATINIQLFINGVCSIGTWNSGPLFGGISSAARAQTRKRRFAEELLTTADVFGIQETRGVEADLLSLPPTHQYFGSFSRPTGPATSASGGVILVVHRSIVGAASEARVRTHTCERGPSLCPFI